MFVHFKIEPASERRSYSYFRRNFLVSPKIFVPTPWRGDTFTSLFADTNTLHHTMGFQKLVVALMVLVTPSAAFTRPAAAHGRLARAAHSRAAAALSSRRATTATTAPPPPRLLEDEDDEDEWCADDADADDTVGFHLHLGAGKLGMR